MAKYSHNEVGQMAAPKLGNSSMVDGLARPGARKPSTSASTPSPARPGGRQAKGRSAGAAPKVARPGGAQSVPRKGR